jgi:hypothetical protein
VSAVAFQAFIHKNEMVSIMKEENRKRENMEKKGAEDKAILATGSGGPYMCLL